MASVATLTGREREVMALVIAGRLNKQIAAELKLSEMTVKVHRGQVTRHAQLVGYQVRLRRAAVTRARRAFPYMQTALERPNALQKMHGRLTRVGRHPTDETRPASEQNIDDAIPWRSRP
jgi:DNA-binding CsgD family transcriptional regulator